MDFEQGWSQRAQRPETQRAEGSRWTPDPKTRPVASERNARPAGDAYIPSTSVQGWKAAPAPVELGNDTLDDTDSVGNVGGGGPQTGPTKVGAGAAEPALTFGAASVGPFPPEQEPVCLCRVRSVGELAFQTWCSLSKTLLYLCEFTWAIVVFGVTANSLYNGSQCALSSTNSTALCRYAIALGVIGWVLVLILSVVYFATNALARILPPVYEMIVQLFLMVWWFIGSVVISASLGSSSPNQVSINTVIAFSWMLFVMHLVHSGICLWQWLESAGVLATKTTTTTTTTTTIAREQHAPATRKTGPPSPVLSDHTVHSGV
ncbi:hypothetical protein CYME_CME106C [Cyanidioschyzon merolae strain 10D]|uniref:MARVEL domain-containing protein n=1 Tax=Cyanidioschyzon merolae (strain NIES-3377 / 10D) TaxID=280699 RepID=M1VAW8_CYAM1|nr:hypothetical protein CYME_CME106C [Cyanidioschyzon merolae strain 10D]BAM79327.1 hypothetical protein CYME_CME106C [Cyanidioschyzon merolae strain 10D]|eukprot:XP_005535613.1 hypothetical protein CYME_CME106C [Cyanidioschyzon merolae strain 10D]